MPVEIKFNSTPLPTLKSLLKGMEPEVLIPILRKYGARMATGFALATPVGKSDSGTPGGALKASWGSYTTNSGGLLKTSVYNRDPRVAKGLLNLLFYGSRAHTIPLASSGKTLHFFPTGEERFRKSVKHPGTRANTTLLESFRRIRDNEAQNLRRAVHKAVVTGKNAE